MTTPTDPNAATAPAAAPTLSGFFKWAGAFGVYTVVLFALDESENWAPVVETFAWLVAVSAVLIWYKEIGKDLSALTGVAL
jgi:hypothetical protein